MMWSFRLTRRTTPMWQQSRSWTRLVKTMNMVKKSSMEWTRWSSSLFKEDPKDPEHHSMNSSYYKIKSLIWQEWRTDWNSTMSSSHWKNSQETSEEMVMACSQLETLLSPKPQEFHLRDLKSLQHQTGLPLLDNQQHHSRKSRKQNQCTPPVLLNSRSTSNQNSKTSLKLSTREILNKSDPSEWTSNKPWGTSKKYIRTDSLRKKQRHYMSQLSIYWSQSTSKRLWLTRTGLIFSHL